VRTLEWKFEASYCWVVQGEVTGLSTSITHIVRLQNSIPLAPQLQLVDTTQRHLDSARVGGWVG
jgi:hypothetical protein